MTKTKTRKVLIPYYRRLSEKKGTKLKYLFFVGENYVFSFSFLQTSKFHQHALNISTLYSPSFFALAMLVSEQVLFSFHLFPKKNYCRFKKKFVKMAQFGC